MSHTKAIDLGRTLGDAIEISPTPISPHEKLYPHLRIEDIEDGRLAELEVGRKATAEITFKVVSKSHQEDKRRGKRHSVTLEVISIELGHDPKFNGKKTSSFVDSARDSFKKNFK